MRSHVLSAGRGRPAESTRGSLRVAASASGCVQLACLFLSAWFPTRATFISRLGESSSRGIPLSLIDRPIRLNLSCASLAASTSPSVSIARIPEAFATLGAIARFCARNAISDRRSIDVASNPPAYLGNRILLMVACSSRSSPTKKGNRASTISSSSCAYEARASGGTTQQSNDKALFRTMVTSFQAGASRLHSKSASHICLILSARIRALCSLPLVGSWFLRAPVVISVRYSPSMAVPPIMRPPGVHFTNRVISSLTPSALPGVGQ